LRRLTTFLVQNDEELLMVIGRERSTVGCSDA
nr:hypothetical protein [Tanacetum cinerariifolium]